MRAKDYVAFFIKSLKVSKVYVFRKFYRWDKLLLDSFKTYRLSENSARKTAISIRVHSLTEIKIQNKININCSN